MSARYHAFLTIGFAAAALIGALTGAPDIRVGVGLVFLMVKFCATSILWALDK